MWVKGVNITHAHVQICGSGRVAPAFNITVTRRPPVNVGESGNEGLLQS